VWIFNLSKLIFQHYFLLHFLQSENNLNLQLASALRLVFEQSKIHYGADQSYKKSLVLLQLVFLAFACLGSVRKKTCLWHLYLSLWL